MTRGVREITAKTVLDDWLQATDQALAALQAWRERLTAWDSGGGLVSREDLRAALATLDAAGLAEWYAFAPAPDLHILAEVEISP